MPCKHKKYVKCKDGLKRRIEIKYLVPLFLEALISAYIVFMAGYNSQLLCVQIETEIVTIVQIQVNNLLYTAGQPFFWSG